MEYLIYLSYYGIVCLIALAINSFMSGFTDTEITFKSSLSSVIWPILLLEVLGTLAAHFKKNKE